MQRDVALIVAALDVRRALKHLAELVEEAHRPRAYAIIRIVIVSLHVATGGAAGVLLRSRVLALAVGPGLHFACDRVPHEDIPDRSFEVGSGLVALGLLAARRGLLDPAVLGGVAASVPDLEHLVSWLRVRGQKVFHRGGGRHGVGMSVEAQLLLAGAVLGFLLTRRG